MKWVSEAGGIATPYWIDLVEVDGLADGHNIRASVKWDGCINLTRTYNGGTDAEAEDCIHICDLDQFIKELEALRIACKEHFKDPWPA